MAVAYRDFPVWVDMVLNNKKIKLNKNNKLRILQVSDTQDLHNPRRAMLKMLDSAYDLINPDLVLLTGDNILGNHLDDARFGTRKVIKTREGSLRRLKKAIGHILKPLEERNIPFAFIFGNHDDMNAFSKDEQADIYMRYSCCIPPYDPKGDVGCGTYNIPIYSSDGKSVVFNIWMIDSAGHDDEGKNGYEYVSKEIVDWYIKKSEEQKVANGGKPLPSLMFQHIPFPEITRMIMEIPQKEKGCIVRDGRYYKLDPKQARGVLSEYPCVCKENFGQFNALLKQSDVKAVAFGHDHLNCFTGRLGGIDIIQTPCASFRCYGNDERGVRLIELDARDGDICYTTKGISYFDIFGKGALSQLRFIMGADEREKQKYALLFAAAAAAILPICLIHKKRKGLKRLS